MTILDLTDSFRSSVLMDFWFSDFSNKMKETVWKKFKMLLILEGAGVENRLFLEIRYRNIIFLYFVGVKLKGKYKYRPY